jgi:outer membrane biosynthesis protein TonB
MKNGLTISVMAHAAVLLWAVVSFAPRTLNAPPAESMPIDIISTTEFSQLRAGARNAPKTQTPKPLVEKVAEKKGADDPIAKIVQKPELITASAQVPPPAADAKPEPKSKAAENKDPKPDPKSDAIADVLKKEQKPEPKKEAKPQPKKPDKPQPKFDANRIAALLDKRDPQRVAAAGDVVNHTLAFGARTGDAPTLSQSEIDAFRQRLKSCWTPPAGAPNADRIKVPITIRLKLDRTLAAPPEVEMRASDPYTQAMIESAVRAIIQCQPYTMFSVSRYEIWKELPLSFDPVEMFGGG